MDLIADGGIRLNTTPKPFEPTLATLQGRNAAQWEWLKEWAKIAACRYRHARSMAPDFVALHPGYEAFGASLESARRLRRGAAPDMQTP